MIEKRFTLEEFGLNFIINDNGRNLTARKTVDLLNELHEENKQLKSEDKNCYNCKHSQHFEDGDTLCEKGCMNSDGYFDYDYHQFKERCICPLWECEDDGSGLE